MRNRSHPDVVAEGPNGESPPSSDGSAAAWYNGRAVPTATTLVLAAGTAALLIAASWGHASIFWGDYGKWLFEVQRVGEGARLYTDVYWPQLPLAAWIFGAWTRLVGSELSNIWTLTSALAMALALLFALHARRLVPGRVAAWVIPPSLVLIFALTSINSAPIGMGMYMPAAPLGAAFLLGALIFAEDVVRTGSLTRAPWIGVACGLALATKIDFWPPIAALLLLVALLAPVRRGALVGALAAGIAIVATPTLAVLLRQFAPGEMLSLLLGFGQAREFAGRSSPTMERVVLEITSASAFTALALALIPPEARSRRHAKWLVAMLSLAALGCAIWVANGPAGATAMGPFGWPGRRELVSELVDALVRHAPSGLFPLAALAAIARWRAGNDAVERRRVLLLVAGVAAAARVRRMGENVEFYQAMIELPLYFALAIEFLPMPAVRAGAFVQRGVVTLACVALLCHWQLSYGFLTRRGWQSAHPTLRGVMHLREGEYLLLQSMVGAADSIDPTRARPLFAFGYSGGFNYFMQRRNPTSTTQGFAFSVHSTLEENVTRVRSANPPAFLLDNRIIGHVPFPRKGVHLLRWRAPTILSPYLRVDRPLFDALAADCRLVTGFPAGSPTFTLYSC